MRVIAGEFRSRRLKTLPGLATRPTPDRLRETLFNVLAPVIDGCVFLDAYAGTGAVGIEALSRGARKCVFVEKNRAAVEVIRENLATLGLENRAEVFTGKAIAVLERAPADIVFLDPPYELEKEYEAALNALGASTEKLVIAQHSSRIELPPEYGCLRRYRVLKQGDNSLSFYRSASSARDLSNASTNASSSASPIGVDKQPKIPRGDTIMPRCSI
jgi:16S rRNA (guanine(966)-N(2))-methyltransferase RsmD